MKSPGFIFYFCRIFLNTQSLDFLKLFAGRYALITTYNREFREILINNMPTYFYSKSYASREYKVSHDRRMIL